MLTNSQYRAVGMSLPVGYATAKKAFQFGTETWQRTGVANVIR